MPMFTTRSKLSIHPSALFAKENKKKTLTICDYRTTSNGAQVIKFSDVSDSNSNSGKINATEIKPNTWLGAIWDTRRAWVFYQKLGNIIIAYNTNQSTSMSSLLPPQPNLHYLACLHTRTNPPTASSV